MVQLLLLLLLLLLRPISSFRIFVTRLSAAQSVEYLAVSKIYHRGSAVDSLELNFLAA